MKLSEKYSRNYKKIKKILLKYDDKIKINKKIYTFILSVLISWFIYQTVFFALNLKHNVVPDEPYHIQFIKIYRDKISPIINHQDNNFVFGDITRSQSYFYHYLLGMISKLFQLDKNFITYLRLINISFSLLTLITFIKTIDLLTKDRFIKISSIIMLSNTLTFTILSGGVSYDNLLNLLSILSVYFFIKFAKEEHVKNLILFFVISLSASIVKISFIPILIVLSIIMFIKTCRISDFKKKIIKQIKKYNKFFIIFLSLLFVISLSLFIERHVINLIKFGTINPSCVQIHSIEECKVDLQYIRDNSFEIKNLKPNILNFIMYFNKWKLLILDSTFGFHGHKYIPVNQLFIYILSFIILISYSSFIRHTRYRKDKLNYFLIFLSSFYILFIFVYVNYLNYLKYELIELAVNGRYIFPVITIVFYLINEYIIRGIKINLLKILYIFFLLVIFIKFGFFWFTEQTNSEWFIDDKPNYVILDLNK